MPGLFAATGSSKLLKDFEDLVDPSRGDRVLAIKEGPFIVGAQEFVRGSVQVMEFQDKLLLVHSSTKASEDQLRNLLKSYLQGEQLFIRAIYQYLASDFSLVLYDKERRRCLVLTDPLGIRKMYYSKTNGAILFSQSLPHVFRTLRTLTMPSTSHILESLDVRNVYTLLAQGFIDAPHTLFKRIKTTLPGQLYTINIDGSLSALHTEWSPYTHVGSNAIEDIRNLMIESIEYHIESLKSIAVLLSGGLDSSLILSLILKHFSNVGVEAFNTSYEGYSEIENIQKIVEFLHFDNVHYLKLPTDPEDIFEHFTQSVKMLDEPHLKGTFLLRFNTLTKIRERGLEVILAGDGADEVFCGYWYNYWVFHKDSIRKFVSMLPDKILVNLCSKLPVALQVTCDAYYLNKRSIQNLIKSHFSIDPRLLFYCLTDNEYRSSLPERDDFISMVSRYLYDALTRTDILTLENYAERMGLTVKFPYLYTPLVRYLSALPPSYKIVNGFTKFLLRALAVKYNYLPTEVVFARKSGFSQIRLNAILSNHILRSRKEMIAELDIADPILGSFLNRLFKQLNRRKIHSVIQYAGLVVYLNSLINGML